jgi:hypothetical protein
MRYSLQVTDLLCFMYPIISAERVPRKRRRFPKLNWPLEHLDIGQAFVVPISKGRDPDGRSVSHLRVFVTRAAERLGRQFSCSLIDNGLAISRIA